MSARSVRGVRGAITVDHNDKAEILNATKELLECMMSENALCTDDVASAFFSLTPDLNAVFPAVAARELGWRLVPLFCTQEIPVPNALSKCIRVLLHINTSLAQDEIVHVFLRAAVTLRPDLGEDSKGKQDRSPNSEVCS